jgi:hypothetical protein
LEILASGGATETQVIIAPLSAASTRPGQVAMGTMVEDPGPTRYWISKRGDPHCYSFYLQFAPSLQDRREFWERNGAAFDDEACIAAESIPSITSEFETVLDDTTAQHGIATLRIREVTLTNLHRQERIASLASVTQIPWTAKVFLYGLPPVPQCPSPSSSEQPGNNFDAADLFARLRATARQEQ